MSFAPAKAKISAELLHRLDTIADGNASTHELAQIKFSAQKLRNVDRQDFLMILGIIAALEGNEEECKQFFRTAFDEFGSEPALVINGYMALSELGQREGALELLREHWRGVRSLEVLDRAFAIFAGSGLITEAREVARELQKMKVMDYEMTISGLEESLSQLSLSESDLYAAALKLRCLVQERGYRRTLAHFDVDHDGELGASLCLRYEFPESAQRVFDLEQSVNRDMLAANLPAVERGLFTWFFRPVSEAPRARHMG